MERAVINRFQKLTPTPAALIVVVAFALVALIDTATGPELSLSLFYLVPVALVSLRWRGAAGQLAALVAALAWVAIDLGSGATYSNPLIPFWNAAVRFGFFGLFSMLIERLQEAIEYQTSLARTDPLTGLPNRRSFEQSARRELARADRLRSRLALAIIDLDDFKLVNDEHGHAAGTAPSAASRQPRARPSVPLIPWPVLGATNSRFSSPMWTRQRRLQLSNASKLPSSTTTRDHSVAQSVSFSWPAEI